LTGRYYNNDGKLLLRRVDGQVAFNWRTGSPASSVPTNKFKVLWTGSIKPTTSGIYTLYTTSNDGVRVYVNNRLYIDDWGPHSAHLAASATMSLTAGRRYTIRVEYREVTGEAQMILDWRRNGTTRVHIPKNVLFSE
jgi:mannan endo-1,4-beta-mannosidase